MVVGHGSRQPIMVPPCGSLQKAGHKDYKGPMRSIKYGRAGNMYYDDNCNECGKELTITGAYLGSYEDCYCEDCGYMGEYLDE